VVRVDRVLDQRHLPLELRVEHGALVELAVDPLEAAPAVGVAEQAQVGAARRGGGVAGAQRRVGLGRAVAVLAADLDRVADLAVEVAVAVPVLLEVAVDALHPLVQVDRGHVDGALELVGASFGTTLFSASSRLPLRSRL
jgi:hypothetical protein